MIVETDLYSLLAQPSARWRHFAELDYVVGVKRFLRFSQKRQHGSLPIFFRV